MARLRLLTPALVATLLGLTGPAFADPSDLGTAQALFDDGVHLMGEKKFSEACPKLQESYRLDPAGGTIIALALCHEGEGRTATAWAEFNSSLSQARTDKRKDRENAASEHLKAIEPKLTRLRIVVEPDSEIDGLEIKKNGSVVGKAQWKTALPTDPADVTIEASAPGHVTWKQVVSVKGEGATVDVKIPRLVDAPKEAEVTPIVTAPPKKDEPAVIASSGKNPYIVYAAIAGTVGVLSTGAGVLFGIRAGNKWDQAKMDCRNNICPSNDAKDAGNQARTSADLSTAFFIVGGVGIAGAVVLYFVGESSKTTGVHVTPVVTPSYGGLTIGGAL